MQECLDEIFSIPQAIIDQRKALNDLVDRYPETIPLLEVSKFLRMKAESLRNAIDRGQCTFGICAHLGTNKSYQIPTSTFYYWFIQGRGWK